MTLREIMSREHPEAVGDHYFGGVARCPCSWGFDDVQACAQGLDDVARTAEQCRACWDRDLSEVIRRG